ncbi:hypothetical protein FQY83_13140 [Luteimonas marina]|uniref:Uncharacterized protein n=1 Tax=Luteimonas marina TaxID=488485 RepID=A0A5C5U050_9GAMM|nr:hypothetical protein [Luteimonas marina]TWT19296.1 hypothetical protein FQY83_13140 [Luteimonas marina]
MIVVVLKSRSFRFRRVHFFEATASVRLRRPGSFLLISVKRNEPKKNAFPDKANPRTGSVRGFSDTASLPWRKTPHIHVRRPTGLESVRASKETAGNPQFVIPNAVRNLERPGLD